MTKKANTKVVAVKTTQELPDDQAEEIRKKLAKLDRSDASANNQIRDNAEKRAALTFNLLQIPTDNVQTKKQPTVRSTTANAKTASVGWYESHFVTFWGIAGLIAGLLLGLMAAAIVVQFIPTSVQWIAWILLPSAGALIGFDLAKKKAATNKSTP